VLPRQLDDGVTFVKAHRAKGPRSPLDYFLVIGKAHIRSVLDVAAFENHRHKPPRVVMQVDSWVWRIHPMKQDSADTVVTQSPTVQVHPAVRTTKGETPIQASLA
jgi:hypothetical protein